jgi:hypothetical protein
MAKKKYFSCSVCGREYYAKGLCKKHYARQSRGVSLEPKKRLFSEVGDVVGDLKAVYLTSRSAVCKRLSTGKVITINNTLRSLKFTTIPKTRVRITEALIGVNPNNLTDKERKFYILYNAGGMSYGEIATILGISRQRVGQLYQSVISKEMSNEFANLER